MSKLHLEEHQISCVHTYFDTIIHARNTVITSSISDMEVSSYILLFRKINKSLKVPKSYTQTKKLKILRCAVFQYKALSFSVLRYIIKKKAGHE